MPNETFSGMSVQDFLSWNPGDGRRWQLVDGEPRTPLAGLYRSTRLRRSPQA